MPGYPWLTESLIDPKLIETKMRTLAWMGHPYTEQDFAGIKDALTGQTELDALIAYLQGLGVKSPDAATEVKP